MLPIVMKTLQNQGKINANTDKTTYLGLAELAAANAGMCCPSPEGRIARVDHFKDNEKPW